MKTAIRVARHLVGPLVFVVILASIDRAAVVDGLMRAELAPLLAGALLVLLAIPIRAWRWNGILARMGEVVSPREALRLYASGTFLGVATPARLGELYKAGPLVDRGMPLRRAVASVLVDRVFDVGIAAAAALLYAAAIARGGAAAAVVAGASALGLVMIARALPRIAGARARRFRALLPGPRWSDLASEGAAALVSRGSLLRAGVLTTAGAAAVWASNHLVVVRLGLPLGPLETAGISAVAGLATLLPVSVLGVGTRDAALLVLLARYGVGPGDAVALATLFLLLNVWTGLACVVALFVPRQSP